MPTKFAMRLLAGTAVSALIAGASIAAEAEARPFDIPQQDAATALQAFAMQSGRQVLFPYEAAKGKTAPEVKGDYSDEEVIALLAASAGLRVTADDGRTVTLRPQFAQAAEGGGGSEVEALIVTAQKREEDIQDVPIAISAFSQEQLETHQIAGGPDLITQVPNMTFTKTNFSSYSVQIRGIGTQAISATTDPAVAVAFNNTPFIRNRFFEQEFYDLQRVEVLRGPQGTLYGRNATAGIVNIISAKPKFLAEAKASADLSNYSSSRLEAMVNIPLVEDKVALRLAGAWTKRDGYATNELTGNPIDGRDLWSTRLSLRFSPSDRIDANLIWEHFEENDDRIRSGKQLCKKHVVSEVLGASGNPLGLDITNIPYFTPLPNVGQSNVPWVTVQTVFSQGCERGSLYSPEAFQTPNGSMLPYYVSFGALGLPIALDDPYLRTTQSPDLRVIESTVDPDYRARTDIGELQINIDLTDDLTLVSETGYSSDWVFSVQDFNRFNTAPGAWKTTGQYAYLVAAGVLTEGPNGGIFCDPQLGCSDRMLAVDLSTAKARQFSQEFRLSSDFDGPFNFSLGANFLRADSEDKYYVFFNALSLGAATQGAYRAPTAAAYNRGVFDNWACLDRGLAMVDPKSRIFGMDCPYIETNPIGSLNDTGHNYFLSKNPYKLISYAAFGESYFNITDTLKVTGGLRWTVDKKEAPRVPSWTLANESWGYPVTEVVEQEWREPTWRLALDWKPNLTLTDQTLVYASYAHGYKAGGANPPPFVQAGADASSYGGVHLSELRPATFEAEFVEAYELGAKNTLADGKVTLNLAGFYYDYTGYQISEIIDRSAFNRNFDATVWGIELESDWRPLENLRFGAKVGYEKTRIADGERAIDLMDRTAGRTDWMVVRPFPTFPSSCVFPSWLFAHQGLASSPPAVPNLYSLGALGGSAITGCEMAYYGGFDPVTGLPYVPNPTQVGQYNSLGYWLPGTYPGWDPLDESQGHNGGEGFFKQLGGNELPNAPDWTATLTADYTLPLPNDWLATLHTDLHWQSESWWRVFNDHEFNKLDEYFTMNLAAIFTNEDAGWKVMAYIKNVTDETAITGAFLNSDDTGLTTNVFLTEPRLYGLRVTKEWTGGPLWGSFGSRREGPYPFTIEIGGQVQRHDAPYETIRPGFAGEYPEGFDGFDEAQHHDLDWGDGRDVKLIYRPTGSPWRVSAGVRYGKTNGMGPRQHAERSKPETCAFGLGYELACEKYDYDGSVFWYSGVDFANTGAKGREEHEFLDFAVGRDAGIGRLSRSTFELGVRFAQFESTTHVDADALPNWDIPTGWAKYGVHHTSYRGNLATHREFEGAGPALSWDASLPLLGAEESGRLEVDWSLSGGVLFGKQQTSVTGTEAAYFYDQGLPYNDAFAPADVTVTAVDISRSRDVTVPTFGASLGLAYRVDRFSIGAGYRWERHFNVLDAGFREREKTDRTIDGPYLKISVGFGGG